VLDKITLASEYVATPISSMKLKGKQKEIGLHAIDAKVII